MTSPADAPVRLASAPAPTAFSLQPSEEQALVRDSMRRFADEVLRPAAAAAEVATAPPPAVLGRAHALGLTALAVPAALGGAAETRAAVTATLVAEELARGDLGLALAALAPSAVALALAEWGSAAQQARWLGGFAGERFVPAALALMEPRPRFDPMRPQAGAVRGGDGGWELHGEKSLVPLGAQAELFLVAAEVRGLGPRLFLVERTTPGLSLAPEPAMGLRGAALGRLRLDGARVGAEALLGGPGRDDFDLGALVDRARIAWGALAVGVGQAVLDYVIPYVNERQAFGEPISHRQGVAFTVADLAIELEGLRLLVERAAGLVDRGLPFADAALLVRAQTAAKAMRFGSDGVQLLGGHGFVKEHPVERWYRDLGAAALMEGAVLV